MGISVFQHIFHLNNGVDMYEEDGDNDIGNVEFRRDINFRNDHNHIVNRTFSAGMQRNIGCFKVPKAHLLRDNLWKQKRSGNFSKLWKMTW